MQWIDTVLIALLLISVLLGLWRGLLREAFSLAGWIAACLLAPIWSRVVIDLIPFFDGASDTTKELAGLVVVFLGVLVIAAILGRIFSKAASMAGLGIPDRLMGAVFGLLRGLLFLLLIVFAVKLSPWHDQPVWRQATTVEWLEQALALLKPALPQKIGKYLS